MTSSSSDEGEIRDSGLDKATTSPQLKGTSVDRQDRTRSRYSPSPSLSIEGSTASAIRRSAERSRSPRGSKRYRDDDHYARGHGDPRRFKVHYEDPQSHRQRGQRSYDDLDKGDSAPTGLRYDEQDRYRDNRSRTRSRSPYRATREIHSRGSYGTKSHRDSHRSVRNSLSERIRVNGYEDRGRGFKVQSVSKGADGPMPTDLSKREAKIIKGYSQQRDDSSTDRFRTEMWVLSIFFIC